MIRTKSPGEAEVGRVQACGVVCVSCAASYKVTVTSEKDMSVPETAGTLCPRMLAMSEAVIPLTLAISLQAVFDTLSIAILAEFYPIL
jgi:hypothetical protein